MKRRSHTCVHGDARRSGHFGVFATRGIHALCVPTFGLSWVGGTYGMYEMEYMVACFGVDSFMEHMEADSPLLPADSEMDSEALPPF